MIKRLLVCLVFLTALAAIAPAGAKGLASVYMPAPYSKLQTYWIGDNGAVRMVWKEHNGRWHEPFDVTPPGLGIPNSPVTSVWSVLNDQLETLWVDGGGPVNVVWTDHDQ